MVDEKTRQRVAEVLRKRGVPEHEIADRLGSEEVQAIVGEFIPDAPPKATIQRVDSGGRTWFEVVDRRARPTVAERFEVERGDVQDAHDRALAASQKYGGAKPWGDV